jgi:phosphate:Na+ symporter
MHVMSDGIQKVAGSRMKSILSYMTKNRYVAVLTGFLITALVQSSSATTVLVVSFVNAALLSLHQAIGVIMGANIGTTVTTWLVSFVGFKFKISAFSLPLIGIGLPFMFAKSRNKKDWGEVLIGFGLLFLGLAFLKDSVPDIKSHPEVLAFLQDWTGKGFLSYLIFVGVGTLLTIIVQSSSAAMAITVTMAYKGWIDFPTAAAVVLGENIGTTITAYLASIGTMVNARRAARAHFVFNLFGVIWMTLVFKQFLTLVLKLAPWDATLTTNLPLNLSLFHTLFNLTNTFICIWFIKYIAIIVEKLVKPGKADSDKVQYTLKYLSSGIMDTAALNIETARNEINKMAGVVEKAFYDCIDLFFNPTKKMGDVVESIRRAEELTDVMNEEICSYLIECSKDAVSERESMNISVMVRITGELESIADSIFRLMMLFQKKYDRKLSLHPNAEKEIQEFSDIIKRFIDFYKSHLIEHISQSDFRLANELEMKVDESRDILKKAARRRLKEGSDVYSELLYIDMLKHLEHIGDYALNISEALHNYK